MSILHDPFYWTGARSMVHLAKEKIFLTCRTTEYEHNEQARSNQPSNGSQHLPRIRQITARTSLPPTLPTQASLDLLQRILPYVRRPISLPPTPPHGARAVPSMRVIASLPHLPSWLLIFPLVVPLPILLLRHDSTDSADRSTGRGFERIATLVVTREPACCSTYQRGAVVAEEFFGLLVLLRLPCWRKVAVASATVDC